MSRYLRALALVAAWLCYAGIIVCYTHDYAPR
jgi:hypothetical protein